MQAKNCRERIINLKQWRIDNALTVDECIERCGDYPSEWTIRKFFAKGSEDKATFKESTVAAIEMALIGKVYAPEIKIPVEDVTRTIEEAVKPLADENKLLHRTVEQQKHILNSLVKLCSVAVLLIISIGIYDFNTPGVGFWGSHVSWVFVLKIAFGIYALGVVIRCFILLRKLKIKYEEEKQLQQDA